MDGDSVAGKAVFEGKGACAGCHIAESPNQPAAARAVEAESLRIENVSLMPADYGSGLTFEEVQNVVAYLKSLTGGDPSQCETGPGVLTWDRLVHADRELHTYLTYWATWQENITPR